MRHEFNIFPFTAIIGQELMKKALILNAINPTIGGVLIKGEKGTAKSTAARALTELLPKIKVVANCPFHCDPANIEKMCNECKKRFEDGEDLPIIEQTMKMVTLPVSATEDRVVGTIDLKKALEDKQLGLEPGILAEVNRGILYIDEVNLLDNHVADLLLDAAAMGYNIIERENISFFHPAKFILIGTMNPEEGDLRPQLLDRFGLCIEVKGEQDLQKRIEIIKARQEFDNSIHAFKEKYIKQQEELRDKITHAQEILSKVKLLEKFLKFISLVCIELGVDGHRADITIAKTAQTLTAFYGRNTVTYDDIKEAMILSLPHRLRKGPFKQQKFDPTEFANYLDNLKADLEKKNEMNDEIPVSESNDVSDEPIEVDDHSLQNAEELNHPTEAEPEDSELEDVNHEDLTPTEIHSIDPSHLQNLKPENLTDDLSSFEEQVFEIGEGITDQARKEILKRNIQSMQQRSKSRKNSNLSFNQNGRYFKFRNPFKREKITDLAIDATLRASLIDTIKHNEEFCIRPQHYRLKVRRNPTNILIIFVLDTSGSMTANKRMSAAKGAILSLLEEIYIRKDKVCLITFSGTEATLVLPPTNSIELASDLLSGIPTGGKTPLSAGLHKALQIAITEQYCRGLVPLIVLLSDGKQNIALYDSFIDDQTILSDLFMTHSIPLICIDTDLTRFNLGFAKELSEKFNAIYYELDRLQAEQVSKIISNEYHDLTTQLDRM
ncbi:MAG TPA: magnesium chelatase subunit D family protein [Candidatus Deferrimicrobium sp.]|nr:magnesium chelatase subunit D family protein [Candidatus Deferrimicrobium sp.]